MNQHQKNDSLKQNFIEYLSSLSVSKNSIKNYKSDISHFLGWAILKVRSFGAYIESLSELLPFLNSDLAIEYKKYLSENKSSKKTINRRLSTLRHLARFLIESQVIDYNFMTGIENVSTPTRIEIANHPLISEFKSYLQSQKVSPNTIKNYTNDIKQFFTWLENNQKRLNAKF